MCKNDFGKKKKQEKNPAASHWGFFLEFPVWRSLPCRGIK